MKPEKQTTTIAETRGWNLEGSLWRQPDKTKAWAGGIAVLPDYLKDLNDIHAAVNYQCEQRGFEFQQAYTRELRAVITRRHRDLNEMQVDFWMAQATADQCCEAYLRAINKWEDSN